jgi:hypothetical protein
MVFYATVNNISVISWWYVLLVEVKFRQWLATGLWFSPGPPVSSTNKIDRHDITEILIKVALNTIKQQTTVLFIT